MRSSAMGRAPDGVAMGVVAAVHGQPPMQPYEHVPFTGSKQLVTPGPISTVQQSWPAVQHVPRQQVLPSGQGPFRAHCGMPQVPFPQYGLGPAQTRLQPPQLAMSLRVLTQKPSQHLNSWQSPSL